MQLPWLSEFSLCLSLQRCDNDGVSLTFCTLSNWISSTASQYLLIVSAKQIAASGFLSASSNMDRIKCLYFLILFSSLILQSLSIDEEIELPSGSHKVNFKSMQLKDSISENSVSTKNKFQKFSDTFKSSILKLKKSHKKIDLVFLVDSSSSVGKMNFLSEIKFVKKVLADFTVSYNHTRVAVVSFSSAGKVVSEKKAKKYF